MVVRVSLGFNDGVVMVVVMVLLMFLQCYVIAIVIWMVAMLLLDGC